jgi:hypothetical protein
MRRKRFWRGKERPAATLQKTTLSGIDSLSLLTTNRDFTRESLATFWATSPATAQAAGMAGTLSARFPDFWPETIRALTVHSAEWTPAMWSELTRRSGLFWRQLAAVPGRRNLRAFAGTTPPHHSCGSKRSCGCVLRLHGPRPT